MNSLESYAVNIILSVGHCIVIPERYTGKQYENLKLTEMYKWTYILS